MTIVEKSWLDIGALADIPLRGARVVKTAVGCIAVFRTAENEAFAIDDRIQRLALLATENEISGLIEGARFERHSVTECEHRPKQIAPSMSGTAAAANGNL